MHDFKNLNFNSRTMYVKTLEIIFPKINIQNIIFKVNSELFKLKRFLIDTNNNLCNFEKQFKIFVFW